MSVRMGHHGGCHRHARFVGAGVIDVGRYAQLGKAVVSAPVKIEAGAYVHDGAVLHAGVTVGHDAVVAEGACVTSDVPPRTVVAGNPARVTGYSVPRELPDVAWWDLPDSFVARLLAAGCDRGALYRAAAAERARLDRAVPPAYHVVVARYNEDLSWIRPFAHRCTVYNKGGQLDAPGGQGGQGGQGAHVVPLPNVGREGHTYLMHVVANYDRLDDVTVFLQGRIDDHVCQDAARFVRDLAVEAAANGTSTNHAAHSCAYYSAHRQLRVGRHPQTLGEWWEAHVGAWPAEVSWYRCALFAATAQAIRRRPREYYARLAAQLGRSVDPPEGHYMERAARYVYGGADA